MKKIVRFFISYIISAIALYLSGYGNLMNSISESMAVTTFLFSALVLAVIVTLIWEMHLSFKTKIQQLSERIEALEENKKETN